MLQKFSSEQQQQQQQKSHMANLCQTDRILKIEPREGTPGKRTSICTERVWSA